MLSNFFSSHLLITTPTGEVFSVPFVMLALLLSLGILAYAVVLYKVWLVIKKERTAKLACNYRSEKIERQGTLLSTIYHSIPDLVCSKDVNSIYTSCNPAFERFAGLPEAELIGKSDMETFKIDEKMARLFIRADQKVLRDERVEVSEEWVTYPNGTQYLLETLKTPMYQNGKVVGMMAIARDVTRRKKAEEQARIANRAKSDFLSHMSHEIRTPLNAIIGMSRIARANINNTEKATASLEHVISASQHLLAILNDILDLSKIDSGKMELSQESNCLIAAYEETNCIIKERCGEKGLRYIHNLDSLPKIQIVFDKLRLVQVFINLLGNAVKFTAPGGTISFSIEILEETERSATLSFCISDNGFGMTKKQLAKLFTSFEQADASISAKFGGTGLGLAISQSLIQMMGGEIKVESTPDVGSSFRFVLTLRKGCAFINHIRGSNTASPPDLEGVRILLVEDVEVNRLIVMEALAETKVEIVEAVDGKDALDKFQQFGDNYFSLIFMDVQMPEINGHEATRQIRSLRGSYSQNIPIIAMTAYAYKEDVNKALDCGMTDHLAKPLNFGQLYQILTRYLGKK